MAAFPHYQKAEELLTEAEQRELATERRDAGEGRWGNKPVGYKYERYNHLVNRTIHPPVPLAQFQTVQPTIPQFIELQIRNTPRDDSTVIKVRDSTSFPGLNPYHAIAYAPEDVVGWLFNTNAGAVLGKLGPGSVGRDWVVANYIDMVELLTPDEVQLASTKYGAIYTPPPRQYAPLPPPPRQYVPPSSPPLTPRAAPRGSPWPTSPRASSPSAAPWNPTAQPFPQPTGSFSPGRLDRPLPLTPPRSTTITPPLTPRAQAPPWNPSAVPRIPSPPLPWDPLPLIPPPLAPPPIWNRPPGW